MTKSTHEATIVDIKLETHENAEKLSVVRLFDGAYTLVCNTKDWEGRTKAVFIPPENYVKTSREEFSFLAKLARADGLAKVKPIKLRGVVSQGLLIPYKEEYSTVENLTNHLEIQHVVNEAEENEIYGQGGPSGVTFSKYDIDGPKYFMKDFQEDWEVVISEKIHGANHSFLYKDNQLYVKGRTQYLSPASKHNAYIALANQPEIEKFCKNNEGLALYGEVYGFQTPYTYGLAPGNRKFLAFDIRRLDGTYLDYVEFKSLCTKYGVPICPELYLGKWSHELAVNLATGVSLVGGTQPKEGIVVKPVVERQNRRFDRAVYKVISPEYNG